MVSGIHIDLNRLTYGEYRQFLAGEIDEITLLTKVVAGWPFGGDPGAAASYDALGLVDWLHVQAALRESIQAITAGN